MTWADSSYRYKKKLVVDGVGGTLTDFPILISNEDIGGDPDLKSTRFGGHLESNLGYDMIFYDSTETSQLPHEIQEYYPATGIIIMWVKQSLSTNPTTIYMYYGKKGVTTDPTSTSTWETNFVMVLHMHGASATDIDNSTGDANYDIASDNGTPIYGSNGQIGKCIKFERAEMPDTEYLIVANRLTHTSAPHSITAWITMDSEPTPNKYMSILDSNWNWSNLIYCPNALDTYITYRQRSDTGNYDRFWRTSGDPGQISTDGTFWHFAATYHTDSASGVEIYLDGSEDTADVVFNTGFTANGDVNSQIGEGSYADPNMWAAHDGNIDEARVSAADRTATWVAANYNNQNSPSTFFETGCEECKDDDGDRAIHPVADGNEAYINACGYGNEVAM